MSLSLPSARLTTPMIGQPIGGSLTRFSASMSSLNDPGWGGTTPGGRAPGIAPALFVTPARFGSLPIGVNPGGAVPGSAPDWPDPPAESPASSQPSLAV